MTPEERNVPEITENHLSAFGHIIASYALAEMMLKNGISLLLDASPHVVHALTDRMGAAALIAKAKSLCVHTANRTIADGVADFAARLENVGVVRNLIAHSTWTRGTRPSSIRPSGIAVKQKKGVHVVGFDDAEPDYTLADFEKVCHELNAISSDIIAFLKTHKWPWSP